MSFSKVLGVHVPIFYFFMLSFFFLFVKNIYIHSFYYIALQFSVYYQSGYNTRHREFVYNQLTSSNLLSFKKNILVVLFIFFSCLTFFSQ